jgi:hypothetical protein
MKKFVAERPFADPDAAARRIVEIANDVEAVQNGSNENGWPTRFRCWSYRDFKRLSDDQVNSTDEILKVIALTLGLFKRYDPCTTLPDPLRSSGRPAPQPM